MDLKPLVQATQRYIDTGDGADILSHMAVKKIINRDSYRLCRKYPEAKDDIPSIITETLLRMASKARISSTTLGGDILKYYNDYLCLQAERAIHKILPSKHIDIDTCYHIAAPSCDVDARIDLQMALSKLSEADRKIITMYSDGYTQKEIAREMNISQSQVSTKYKRIIIQLREDLSQ